MVVEKILSDLTIQICQKKNNRRYKNIAAVLKEAMGVEA